MLNSYTQDNIFFNFLDDYGIATDEVELALGEPLWRHTSFKIGGSAEIYARPYTEEALLAGIRLCRRYEFPFTVIGKGTNLLVSDRGVRGVVFELGDMNAFRVSGETIEACAGATLAALAHAAAEASLCGLEFAAGIPGTLGGGIFMNAGAFDGEMKNVLTAVRVLDPQQNVLELSPEDLELSYRHSNAEEKGYTILSAKIHLQAGNKAEIEAKMRDYAEKRREKQPLELPSAGSTFKRPAGQYAGGLIEAAGLKGLRIGDAQVSEKHAGFIVNTGVATAGDVRALIDEVIRRVEEHSGFRLEPEVRMLGDF